MARILTLTTVALTVILAGCQPPAKPVTTSATPPTSRLTPSPTPPPTPDPTADPNAEPKPGATPPPAKAPREADLRLNPKHFEVAPAVGAGWVDTPLPNLGAEADAALTQERDLLGQTVTLYEAGGSKLKGKGAIKLRGGKTFSAEYFLPETEASKNVLRGDGSQVAQLERKGWTSVRPSSERELSAGDVQDWVARCSRSQLGALDGSPGWSAIVTALLKGGSGFTARTQAKTTLFGGKNVTVNRIIAENKADDAEFEAIFSGDQRLPLTVRYHGRGKDGKPRKIMWTCDWSQGGTHDPKSFEIPAERL